MTGRDILNYLNTLSEQELEIEVGYIDADTQDYYCAWAFKIEKVLDIDKEIKAIVMNYMG